MLNQVALILSDTADNTVEVDVDAEHFIKDAADSVMLQKMVSLSLELIDCWQNDDYADTEAIPGQVATLKLQHEDNKLTLASDYKKNSEEGDGLAFILTKALQGYLAAHAKP